MPGLYNSSNEVSTLDSRKRRKTEAYKRASETKTTARLLPAQKGDVPCASAHAGVVRPLPLLKQ